MRKRYSRSYTVLSFLTMFSYREQPFRSAFFMLYFIIENMYKLIHTHFHEAVTGNGGCFVF